ncbi:hypothetical protein ACFLTZ_00975 [Chloroflexota bacterium]
MEIQNKNIKRKLEAWLSSLIYHSTQGKADIEEFGQRLQGVIAPIVAPEALQEVAHKALSEISSLETHPDLKDKLIEGCTAEKLVERMALTQELLMWKPTLRDGKPQSIGDLVKGWAELTEQDAGKLQERLYTRLIPLVADWQRKTGCPGFTDEAVFQHPQEAGEFMNKFIRLLIEETPQAKLIELLRSALRTITETPSVDFAAELQGILRDSCGFTTWKTGRQVGATIEAKPEVKAALLTPEVAALVEYEEHRQGHGGDAQKAVRILADSLAAELCQHSMGAATGEALAEALKSVGRRSLLSNLMDAIRGQLRVRILMAISDWISKLPRIEWKVKPLPDDGGIYRILVKEEEK